MNLKAVNVSPPPPEGEGKGMVGVNGVGIGWEDRVEVSWNRVSRVLTLFFTHAHVKRGV